MSNINSNREEYHHFKEIYEEWAKHSKEINFWKLCLSYLIIIIISIAIFVSILTLSGQQIFIRSINIQKMVSQIYTEIVGSISTIFENTNFVSSVNHITFQRVTLFLFIILLLISLLCVINIIRRHRKSNYISKNIKYIAIHFKNEKGISEIYQEVFRLRLKISYKELHKFIKDILKNDSFKSNKQIDDKDYNKYLDILIDNLQGRINGTAHAVKACEMGLINLQNSLNKDEKEIFLQDLRITYTGYITRFTNDNQRIWNTGSIFVPVSLAGFVAYIRVDENYLSSLDLIILSLSSILLILSWVIIAENQRSFQNKSMIWIRAITKFMKINFFSNPKFIEDNDILSKSLTNNKGIRFVRIQLPIIIIVTWITIVLYEFFDRLPAYTFLIGFIIWYLFEFIFNYSSSLSEKK